MADRVNWSEAHLEARLNSSFYNGVRSGIENAIGRLRKRSGDAFAANRDTMASALREAADDITRELLDSAQAQEERIDNELREAEAEDRTT